MSQTTINNGDTGLVARTAINDNFSELYKFPNVHVENFGAVGDGETDDMQAFLDAVTYARANNLCNIVLSKKDYFISDNWDVAGLNIIGNNARILRNGVDKVYISAWGSKDSLYYLTEDVTKNDMWMVLPADFIATLSNGDIIKIISDEICGPISGEDVNYG